MPYYITFKQEGQLLVKYKVEFRHLRCGGYSHSSPALDEFQQGISEHLSL